MCSFSPSDFVFAQMALISSGEYAVPTSVLCVIETACGFGKWRSVRFLTVRSMPAGSIFPFSPGSSSTFVPLLKNSGAPHSSVSTCASSWQRMLW